MTHLLETPGNDDNVELGASGFSPRACELFEEARCEVETHRAAKEDAAPPESGESESGPPAGSPPTPSAPPPVGVDVGRKGASKRPLIMVGMVAGLALAASGGCDNGSGLTTEFLEFFPLIPDPVQSATEPFGAALPPPYPRTFQYRFSMGQAGPVVAELTSFTVSGSNNLGVSTLIELAEGNCDTAATCSVVAARELGEFPIPGTTEAPLALGINTVRVTISADPDGSISSVAFIGQVTHPR